MYTVGLFLSRLILRRENRNCADSGTLVPFLRPSFLLSTSHLSNFVDWPRARATLSLSRCRYITAHAVSLGGVLDNGAVVGLSLWKRILTRWILRVVAFQIAPFLAMKFNTLPSSRTRNRSISVIWTTHRQIYNSDFKLTPLRAKILDACQKCALHLVLLCDENNIQLFASVYEYRADI